MSSESCNSRHFSWLIKSCFPNPQSTLSPSPTTTTAATSTATTNLSCLPDDLLLECLSRVPSSCLPSISLVCRRWLHLLHSPHFLSLRRLHNLLHHSIFALSASSSAASLTFHGDEEANVNCWKVASFLPLQLANNSLDNNNNNNFSYVRLSAIGQRIYIIGRHELVCYDLWTGMVAAKCPMIFPRKKFAAAAVSEKIYVAGGAAAVEEYDPESNSWSVVAHAPRRRYGCIGAAVEGVFYIIGGLKIGGVSDSRAAAAVGAEAHVYASSMDLYDVEARGWMRSRAVPGGGCVVAACAAVGQVYILASHAVELSFWRFDARRQSGGAFGEWHRIKSPPLPALIRLDGTVRFSCVGVQNKVVLTQIIGSIDDLLRRSGRNVRGLKGGLVLIYDCISGEWSRGPDLPEVIQRAAVVSVEC